jgi:hypothetical protein
MSVVPTASRSTIPLSSVYQLQLLPLFDRFGRCAWISLCLFRPVVGPTPLNFLLDIYMSLGTLWAGLDHCFPTTFCHDRVELELEDPTTSVIASLPAGHYRSPNDGAIACISALLLAGVGFLADTHALCDNSIAVDISSKSNQCCNGLIAVFTEIGAGTFPRPLFLLFLFFQTRPLRLPRRSSPRIRDGFSQKLCHRDGRDVYFRVTLSFS